MSLKQTIVPWGEGLPVLPVRVLVGQDRGGRTLCVTAEPVHFLAPGHPIPITVPAGYLTDWASIPRWVQWRIQPFGRHAAAALLHDWLYAVGEPGRREEADALFVARLAADGVNALRRSVMHRAVRLAGQDGYGRAAEWWASQNFADPLTGAACAPPAARESFFNWGRH